MRKSFAKIGALVALMLVSVVAFATPPDPLDYTAAITTFTDQMTTFITTNAGPLLAALAIMLSLGLVWKLIKRAARSV